ncbi:hypothetical protein VPH35_111621 [Triticum aestivum]|uniref:Pectinesterase inhibitor domain-containing protein n=1 Tax=Triticum aestivum TaxID=4565 RepID=A0A3B6PQ51_WHEAT
MRCARPQLQLHIARRVRILRALALSRSGGLFRHGRPRASGGRGLAAAAASLTVANITSTELIIADLVKNLGSCLSDYKEIKDMVRRGLDDIRGGRAADASKKFLDAAEADVPSLCDLILIEGVAKRNPIDQENQNAYFLSVMASDITQLMLDSHA